MPQLDYAQTIALSKDKLLELCEEIFTSLDYGKVEPQIARASKIRFGVKAYELGITYTDQEAQQRIILTLNLLNK